MSNRRTPFSADGDDGLLRSVQHYYDGELTGAELSQFNQLLRRDVNAQQLFVDYALQASVIFELMGAESAMLDSFNGDAEESSSLIMEAVEEDMRVRAAKQTADAEAQSRQAAHGRERKQLQRLMMGRTEPVQPVKRVVIPKAVFYGAIATVAAMLLLMILPMFESKPVVTPPMNEPVVSAPQFVQVAVLVEQIDAHWIAPGSGESPVPGDALLNQPMHLTSGLAKIRFNNEAEVILEAPCSIEPIEPNRIALNHGAITVSCRTLASKGFVIQSEDGGVTLTDLGTSFGVAADKNGELETQILEGLVRVDTTVAGRPPVQQTLMRGQAAVVNNRSGQLSMIAPQAGRFITSWAAAQSEPKSTSGAIRYLREAPQSFEADATESQSHIFLVCEQSEVALPRDITVGLSKPGGITAINGQLEGFHTSAGVLRAGKKVKSYLLHFDPPGNDAGEDQLIKVEGQATFRQAIVGVIVDHQQLEHTDSFFAIPKTSYPPSGHSRGIESSASFANDVVSVSPDRRSLSLELYASSSLDQIRVLVEAE